MKLVSDAKDFWKWNSTQFMLILAALPSVWMQLPEDLKASIPETAMPWISLALFAAGVLARVRDQ